MFLWKAFLQTKIFLEKPTNGRHRVRTSGAIIAQLLCRVCSIGRTQAVFHSYSSHRQSQLVSVPHTERVSWNRVGRYSDPLSSAKRSPDQFLHGAPPGGEILDTGGQETIRLGSGHQDDTASSPKNRFFPLVKIPFLGSGRVVLMKDFQRNNDYPEL